MNLLQEVTQRIWASDVASGRIGSLELNAWLAQLTGIPLMGLRPESRIQRLGILVRSTFILPCLFCYVCLEIYDLILNWTDVDVMTQNVLMTLTHVGYWIKVRVSVLPRALLTLLRMTLLQVLNTYYHYGEIKEIVSQLSCLTRTCVLSARQRSTFHEVEVENKLVCLMYFCLVVFSSSTAMVMLLIGESGRTSDGLHGLAIFFLGAVPDEMAGQRFPYRAQMPGYLPPLVQQLYMGLSVIWISCGIPTIDNMNVLLMNQICLHLKVLNMAFDALEGDTLGQRLKVDPHSWLHSIVQYHCSLIKLRQRMERVYRLPMMIQFVSSLVVVAMTVFQMLVGDGSNSSMLVYFMLSGVLCQIFLYCWFGNEVFEQSKTLSTSGFRCDWLQFDVRFRRCLVIFMVNADRPFLFTAGGFMGLTLTSFTNILSKSYSVVAVLRQMYGRTQ
ncbi:hypothetical protein KR054_004666 [Drosophila jambulina]|nr:hypothetical protein KR054_004666 [Drosophila jambulina]